MMTVYKRRINDTFEQKGGECRIYILFTVNTRQSLGFSDRISRYPTNQPNF